MIDTHLHVWELSHGWYAWNTPALGPVHADSSIDDVTGAMAAAGVSAALLVQAADILAETDWLLGVAAREPSVGGVVGYLPLVDPAELARVLRTYAGTGLAGVRQLWHDHDRHDELADPDVLTSLGMLGAAGLAVDVPDAYPRLMPALLHAARNVPQTTFVLDHCGKPPFGDRTAWATWEAQLAALTVNQNVVIKLSGLFGGSGSGVPPTDQELARVLDVVLDLAGPQRTMIGSDWPMTRGVLSYAESIDRIGVLLGRLAADDLAAVTERTARRVYGLANAP